MKPLAVYHRSTRKRLAFLENAFDITYTQQTNAVWHGSFKLPYADYKKQYCEPFNYIQIWDIDAGNDDRYIGLFKIMLIYQDLDAQVIEYTLEHVMINLLDGVIIGYKSYTTDNTSQLITKLLLLQDQTQWVLNTCDYTNVGSYEFEDVNLLNAIYHVVYPLTEDHYWTFDTQVFPWQMNLKKVSTVPVTDIRYKKNILGITKKEDARSICTRIWLFGKEINGTKLHIGGINGGLKYLQSSTGVAEYGIINKIIDDSRFEIAEHLKAYGAALLSKLDKPLVTYEVDIQAIYNAANLKIGDVVRIVTDEGLNENLIVQEITKNDIGRSPNSGKIKIGQGTVDIGLIAKDFI